MAEKPILFSNDMVRAIIDGAKTQTRRVIKPQSVDMWEKRTDTGVWADILDEVGEWKQVPCPYGKPGDRLWVREAWRVGEWNEEDCLRIEYRAGLHCLSDWLRPPENQFERLWVESTDDAIKAGLEPDENGMYYWSEGQAPTRWRPSIFMPRWASRIELEVKHVRMERVQSTIYHDVEAEGVAYVEGITPEYWVKPWADLWNSINAKRGYSFDSNPMVWVIEFEMLDR